MGFVFRCWSFRRRQEAMADKTEDKMEDSAQTPRGELHKYGFGI